MAPADLPSTKHFWTYVIDFVKPSSGVSKWGREKAIDFWWNACEAELEFTLGDDAYTAHRDGPARPPIIWPPREFA